MRVNNESIGDMLNEYGSFEGGFDTPEEVWGDVWIAENAKIKSIEEMSYLKRRS